MVKKVLKSAVFSSFLVYFEHPPFGGVWAGYVLNDPLTCSGTTQKGVKKWSKSAILVAKNDQKRCPKSDTIFGRFRLLQILILTVQNNSLFGPKIDQKWVIFDVIFDPKKVTFYVILDTLFGPNRPKSPFKGVQKEGPKSDPKRSLFGHFLALWDPQK